MPISRKALSAHRFRICPWKFPWKDCSRSRNSSSVSLLLMFCYSSEVQFHRVVAAPSPESLAVFPLSPFLARKPRPQSPKPASSSFREIVNVNLTTLYSVSFPTPYIAPNSLRGPASPLHNILPGLPSPGVTQQFSNRLATRLCSLRRNPVLKALVACAWVTNSSQLLRQSSKARPHLSCQSLRRENASTAAAIPAPRPRCRSA